MKAVIRNVSSGGLYLTDVGGIQLDPDRSTTTDIPSNVVSDIQHTPTLTIRVIDVIPIPVPIQEVEEVDEK